MEMVDLSGIWQECAGGMGEGMDLTQNLTTPLKKVGKNMLNYMPINPVSYISLQMIDPNSRSTAKRPLC